MALREVCLKTFFWLTGAYEGLRVRRLAQSGRLVLYRVLNDGPPYWLIQVKNFQEEVDRPKLGHESIFGNGTFRVVALESAERLYRSLLPNYPENRRIKNPEYLRAMQERGKALSEKRMLVKTALKSGAGQEQAVTP
jgi:hypothetical protein